MRFTVSNNLQGLLARQISLNLLLSTYPRQGHKVGPDIRPLNSLSENTNNAYVTSIPAGQCWWIYYPSTPPSSHMCPLLSRHHVPRFCSRLQCLCSLSPVSCVFFSRFSPTLLSSSYPQTVPLNSVTDYFMWSPIPGVAVNNPVMPHYREPPGVTFAGSSLRTSKVITSLDLLVPCLSPVAPTTQTEACTGLPCPP